MAGSKTTDYSILSFVDGVIPSAARNLALSTSREAESREVEKFLTPRLLDSRLSTSRLVEVLNSSTLDSRLLDSFDTLCANHGRSGPLPAWAWECGIRPCTASPIRLRNRAKPDVL